MALHKAEQIMAAVLTLLTGLTTTGSNVSRHRVAAVDTYPWLVIRQGQEDPAEEVGEHTQPWQVMRLRVGVMAYVQSTTPETQLNLISKEVQQALLADITLGLGFVVWTRYAGADNPDLQQAEKRTGMQEIFFDVTYTRDWRDPSA